MKFAWASIITNYLKEKMPFFVIIMIKNSNIILG
jgi:hypothetical protein